MAHETPVYECRKVPSGSIVIDGDLSDPGWQMAEPIANLVLADGSGPASRRTECRMCWDDDYLYICFNAEDPDIWGTMLNHDDPIWEEEVVEAFISPDSGLVNYYELEMNPLGVKFDAAIHNPLGHPGPELGLDLSWTCEGWLSAVAVDGTVNKRDEVDRRWTVEWAIPFKSLAGAPNTPPKDGDTWRINLYRIDLTPTPEFSCWSPTHTDPASFHIPSHFGTIVFRE